MSRIDRVVYGHNDLDGGFAEYVRKCAPQFYKDYMPIIVGGILKEESGNLFKEFLKQTPDWFNI